MARMREIEAARRTADQARHVAAQLWAQVGRGIMVLGLGLGLGSGSGVRSRLLCISGNHAR